ENGLVGAEGPPKGLGKGVWALGNGAKPDGGVGTASPGILASPVHLGHLAVFPALSSLTRSSWLQCGQGNSMAMIRGEERALNERNHSQVATITDTDGDSHWN